MRDMSDDREKAGLPPADYLVEEMSDGDGTR